MNSKDKGKRGERMFAQFLRDHGYTAKRGQQHAGSPDSPDVVSNFPFHIEVKFTERLSLRDATAQAEGDSGSKPWIVAHRRKHSPWLVTLKAEDFVSLVRETR